MEKLETKYRSRIIVPFIVYVLLVIFTALYILEFYEKGRCLYPEVIQSKLLDHLIGLFLMVSVFIMPVQIYYYCAKLIIEGDCITVKRPFKKPFLLHKSDVVYKEGDDFSRYSIPCSYFIIIINRPHTVQKIKISKHFIRNYKEMQLYFKQLSRSQP